MSDQDTRGLRIILLSCAGAPFSAEMMRAVQAKRPDLARQVTAAVLSLPRISPSAALPPGKRWRRLLAEDGMRGLWKELALAVEYRANGLLRQIEAKLDAWRGAPCRRIEDYCRVHRVPVYTTRDVNSSEMLARLRALAPDVIVIATFHNILRKPAIETAGIAALNVHPSFLPALRGADPINLALQQRVKQTGVTIHLVDEGIDTGDILIQQALPVPPRASEKILRPRLAELAGALLIKSLDDIARGELSARRQAGCAEPVNRTSEAMT